MLDAWLARLQEAVQQRDGFLTASLIDVSGQTEQFDQLATALNVSRISLPAASPSLLLLQSTPALRPSSFASLTRSYFPQSRQFADFLSAYLLFLRDADLNPYDEDATAHAYKLLEDCFRYLSALPPSKRSSSLKLQRSRQGIRPRRHGVVRADAPESYR